MSQDNSLIRVLLQNHVQTGLTEPTRACQLLCAASWSFHEGSRHSHVLSMILDAIMMAMGPDNIVFDAMFCDSILDEYMHQFLKHPDSELRSEKVRHELTRKLRINFAVTTHANSARYQAYLN